VQHTLVDGFERAGIGLHSGRLSTVQVGPGPVDSGFVFQRVDLPGAPLIPALWQFRKARPLSSCLELKGAEVATVEHLLSALFGMGVDNALIRIDGPECPVLDGSALPWCAEILGVGVVAQSAPCKRLGPKAISIQDAERSLSWTPGPGLKIEVTTEFPFVGREQLALTLSPAVYQTEVAWARTFGFQKDLQRLHSAGLALGGSQENALGLGDNGPLNPGGFRGKGEMIRHKILDLVGDLALAGGRLQGRMVVNRPGHAFTHAFLKALGEAERP
jgi:UDP-3-O-[3-hydroxymyristoyl] N-acetylglucosamine deacetylase